MIYKQICGCSSSAHIRARATCALCLLTYYTDMTSQQAEVYQSLTEAKTLSSSSNRQIRLCAHNHQNSCCGCQERAAMSL